MNFKLTSEEKKWVLYDIGNSAFVLMVSTLIPIFFNTLSQNGGLSEDDYLAFWGYAASAATLIIAVAGPILGAVSDRRGRKKPLFALMVLIGIVGCTILGFIESWLLFLIVFIITKAGYSGSLIFYDSMLPDITDNDRMDNVSAQGYAWGYIGSCAPFLVCLGLYISSQFDAVADFFGMSAAQYGKITTILSFVITAVWWLLCTLPLYRSYHQKHYVDDSRWQNDLKRLGHTIVDIAKDKRVLLFVVAFFFYIDGVYTIIDMATAYGTALGFDTIGLLIALLVTQIVGFPAAIVFGRLSKRLSSVLLLSICIAAYFGIAVFAMLMNQQIHFWILAVIVGLFQGGIQALSRSYFAKIIPPEKSGEYFGLLDICGKGASFLGTMTVSVVTQITNNGSLGVGAIAIFFIIGLVFFLYSVKLQKAGGANKNANNR